MSAYARAALQPSRGWYKNGAGRQDTSISKKSCSSKKPSIASSKRKSVKKNNRISFGDVDADRPGKEVAVPKRTKNDRGNRGHSEFEPLSQLTEVSYTAAGYSASSEQCSQQLQLSQEQPQYYRRHVHLQPAIQKPPQQYRKQPPSQQQQHHHHQLGQFHQSQGSASSTGKSMGNNDLLPFPLAQHSQSSRKSSSSVNSGGSPAFRCHAPLRSRRARRDMSTSVAGNLGPVPKPAPQYPSKDSKMAQPLDECQQNESGRYGCPGKRNMDPLYPDQRLSSDFSGTEMEHLKVQSPEKLRQSDDGDDNNESDDQTCSTPRSTGNSSRRSVASSLWNVKMRTSASNCSQPVDDAKRRDLAQEVAQTPRRMKKYICSALHAAFKTQEKKLLELENRMDKRDEILDAKARQLDEREELIEAKIKAGGKDLESMIEAGRKEHMVHIEYINEKCTDAVRAAKEAGEKLQTMKNLVDTAMETIKAYRDTWVEQMMPIISAKATRMVEAMVSSIPINKFTIAGINKESPPALDEDIPGGQSDKKRMTSSIKKAQNEVSPDVLSAETQTLMPALISATTQASRKRTHNSPLREGFSAGKPRRSKRLKMAVNKEAENTQSNDTFQVDASTIKKNTNKKTMPIKVRSATKTQEFTKRVFLDCSFLSPSERSCPSSSNARRASDDISLKVRFKGPITSPTIVNKDEHQSYISPFLVKRKKKILRRGKQRTKIFSGSKTEPWIDYPFNFLA